MDRGLEKNDIRTKNSNDFADRVIANHVVSAADDQFGTGTVEVTAPIRNDTIRSPICRSRVLLADHAMIWNLNRKFRKRDKRVLFGIAFSLRKSDLRRKTRPLLASLPPDSDGRVG